ncbi:5386_t:CDS:2 [Ambispora gerdemannii]|uniref:DNA-directed RNA polymerase II subunit RPB9 n=1 Tax=Ambispora gerdemannii TaxID=144530 RepID=A0A9N9AJS9_9GLOM|nr:5386_t:CDS:2 [Ambispora gerdemannii]
MLYPKEDKEIRLLTYACRNCEYQEPSENQCVYRNDVENIIEQTTSEIKDLAADPTFPRTKKQCPKCGHDEAVFFQSPSRRLDTKMTLFYACADKRCGYRWTYRWTWVENQGEAELVGIPPLRPDLDDDDLQLLDDQLQQIEGEEDLDDEWKQQLLLHDSVNGGVDIGDIGDIEEE